MEGKWAWTPERLKELRLSLKMNRNQFAKLIGTTANLITSLEEGKHKPSMEIFLNICNIMKISPHYFFTYIVFKD